MEAFRRTLQEGFALATLAPVCMPSCDLHSPPPHVSIGATPLYNGCKITWHVAKLRYALE